MNLARNGLLQRACLWGLGWLALAAPAQELRDPTRAPALPSAATAAMTGPVLPITSESQSVVMRDGQPYLVVGTRLVGIGQTVGEFKLERITETEIWLRQGKAVYPVARFSRIQRSSSPDCASSVAKTAQDSSRQARGQQANRVRATPGSQPTGPSMSSPAQPAPIHLAAPCESSPQ